METKLFHIESYQQLIEMEKAELNTLPEQMTSESDMLPTTPVQIKSKKSLVIII